MQCNYFLHNTTNYELCSDDNDDNLATIIIHHDDWIIYSLAGHYLNCKVYHLKLVKATTGYYNVLCRKKLCLPFS